MLSSDHVSNKGLYENAYFTCQLINGVMMIKFKNTYITEEVAVDGIQTRLAIADGGTYPTCSDISRVKGFSSGARKAMVHEDATRGVRAGAIIVETAIGRSIYNFFMKFNKPPIPAKAFTDVNEALEWLEVYKPDRLN